jgi:hypothetical protein
MEPTHRLSAQRDQIVVTVREQSQHSTVINQRDRPQTRMAYATMAAARAS